MDMWVDKVGHPECYGGRVPSLQEKKPQFFAENLENDLQISIF
jgi:hypothetical protein